MLLLWRIGRRKMVGRPFHKSLLFTVIVGIVSLLPLVIPASYLFLFYLVNLIFWFWLLHKIYQFSWGQTIKTGLFIVIITGVLTTIVAFALLFTGILPTSDISPGDLYESQSTSVTKTEGQRTYSLPVCGVVVLAKNGDSVESTNIGEKFGAEMEYLKLASGFSMECRKVDRNDSVFSSVSKVLSIQSSGSQKVDKNIYKVFDSMTLSDIKDLYSAKNRGYCRDCEDIGFQSDNWIYIFSFKNPDEARNQDTFIIAVGGL